MKRSNYVVSSNNHSGSADVVSTGRRIRTYTVTRVIRTGHHGTGIIGKDGGVSDCNGYNEQTGGSLREEDRVEREPVCSGCFEQIIRCSWSLAIDVGQTQLVDFQTDIRSTQICSASL